MVTIQSLFQQRSELEYLTNMGLSYNDDAYQELLFQLECVNEHISDYYDDMFINAD